MKKENLPTTASSEITHQLPSEDLDSRWQRVVGRRTFLKGIGIASATLSAGALLTTEGDAQGALTRGDVALLKFAAWAEVVETDLWTQYAELGAVDGGNPAYMAALSNLDSDMPQYIRDNTDDEISHAAFLNAFLISKGEEPVDLDAFRTLQGSQATGPKQLPRLTSLLKLNVDLSWYTRYRSAQNPRFGGNAQGPLHHYGRASHSLRRHRHPAEPAPTGASRDSPRGPHAGHRQYGGFPLCVY